MSYNSLDCTCLLKSRNLFEVRNSTKIHIIYNKTNRTKATAIATGFLNPLSIAGLRND